MKNVGRPVVKGKANWNRTFPLSLSPSVIDWLKEKKRKVGITPSAFVNRLLEAEMVSEIERSY